MSLSVVELRLTKFVKCFVELFESYFSEYHRRLIERSPNAGKFVRLFEEAVGIGKSGGEVLDEVPKASTLIALDLVVKLAKVRSSHDNWNELLKLAPKLLDFGEDDHLYSDRLIEGAAIIFVHFEAQFMNVSSESGWEYAIRKVANDAVNRVINYLRNPDTEIDLNSICKGVIVGKSKRYTSPIGFPNFHKGHTIKLLGKEITTKKLFEGLGVIIQGCYYEPKINQYKLPFDHGAWFRLTFEWESHADAYDRTNNVPNSHTYQLKGSKLEELESLKQIIDEKQVDSVTKKELDEIRNDANQHADSTAKLLTDHHNAISGTLKDIVAVLKSLKEQSAKTEKIAKETLDATVVIKELALEIRGKLGDDKVQDEPIWFNVKPSVPMFTGRKKELGDLCKLVFRDVTSPLSNITVVFGLGGAGKTQLALRFANENRNEFHDVAWLNAENERTLGEAFVDLAKNSTAKISTINSNGKEMAVEAVVQKVKRFFCERQKRTLLIFDNADKSYDLREYLPISDSSSSQTDATTKVLITSREGEWSVRYPDIKELNLREFIREDAVDFVCKSLSIERGDVKKNVNELGKVQQCGSAESGDDEKHIEELVDTLQRLPLALEQAVAYIRNAKVVDKYSVAVYLKDYKDKTEELLQNEIFKDFLKAYDNTTFATWNLTIDRISKHESVGALAEKIVCIASFIAPDDIHREIFFRLKEVDRSKIKDAVRLIVKYSMMIAEEGQNVLSIHRLVQEVMRLRLQKNGHFGNHLDSAISLMESWCSFDEPELEEISRYLQFVPPHVEALVFHLTSGVDDLLEQNGKSRLMKLKKALSWLFQIYNFKHDFERLPDILMRITEILGKLVEQQMSSQEERRTLLSKADALVELGDVYAELEKYPEALEARKQALLVLEKLGDQTLMAELHSKMADVYRCTLELTKSKESCKQALEILDGHKKGNDPHVVMNKLGICLSLWLVDDGKRTIDLIKDNLNYWEQCSLQGSELSYVFTPKQVLDLGVAYMKIGNKEKATACCTKSLEMCEKFKRDLFFARMISMMNDSNVGNNLRLDLEIHLENSLRILMESQGAQHVETIKFIFSFAKYCFMMGGAEKGLQLMGQALNIARTNKYDIQSDLLVYLGRYYNRIGEYGKAREAVEEGLSVLELHSGDFSMKLFASLETLASVQENLGDPQKQRDLYNRLLLVCQEQCEEGDYRLAWVQVRLGQALGGSGDKAKSEELIRKGLPILIEHFGTEERAVAATSTYLVKFDWFSP